LEGCICGTTHPKIKSYQNKLAKKYETERKISKKDYVFFKKENGYLALTRNQINM